MSQTEGARLFREAWIAGVRKHFPGEPNPGYVTEWEDTPEWERQAAGAVHDQVRQFLNLSDDRVPCLTREQKSRFVATCWNAQVYRHFEDPKLYVVGWSDLPRWQKETNADIFEAIANASKQSCTQQEATPVMHEPPYFPDAPLIDGAAAYPNRLVSTATPGPSPNPPIPATWLCRRQARRLGPSARSACRGVGPCSSSRCR